MRINRAFLFLGLMAAITAGCKKKADENQQPPAPPPFAAPAVDTTTVLDIDTLPAVQQIPAMPPAPTGSGFAVQVASATDADYARYLVDLWRERGYEPFVTSILHNDETHYRIRLGFYDSYAQAKRMVAELEDKYSLKSWIDQM